MERRTSFEMRKMPEAERGQDTNTGRSESGRRWGPRQLINGPPGLRLRKTLRKERREMMMEERGMLSAGKNTASLLPSSQDQDNNPEWLGWGREAGGIGSAESYSDYSLGSKYSDDQEPALTLWVCRHTDRYTPDWVHSIAENLEQLNASRAYAADIPLSPLGHQQAQELANFLARQRVSVVISSPYLRTLQVAQKVSHATGAKIWVEPGLCEGPRHVKGTLPPLEERYRYFPEIDMSYKPATEEPDYEEEDLSVIPRSMTAAARICADLKVIEPEGGVAIISHGSVVLGFTAALLEGADSVNPAEVPDEERISQMRSTLDNMDSVRPGGYFKVEWYGEADISWGEVEDEGKYGWWGDMACETGHLSREACDTNSGTRSYDFPPR